MMTMYGKEMRLLVWLITFAILSYGEGLQCYDCKVSASIWQECDSTAQHCTGDCATLMTSERVSWGIVTTERRRCVPTTFSDENLCKIQKIRHCDNMDKCTCAVTRCTTDQCNDFPEYIIMEPETEVESEATAQTSKGGSNAARSIYRISISLLTTILILIVR